MVRGTGRNGFMDVFVALEPGASRGRATLVQRTYAERLR